MSQPLTPWINVPESHDFSIYNLPFGIFSTLEKSKRIGVAIGDQILDLNAAHSHRIFHGLNIDKEVLVNDYLNDFIALGKATTTQIRLIVQKHLCDNSSPLFKYEPFFKKEEVTMHLPVKVGDYTDFYSSIEHATNVGKMFRDPKKALLPNWKHLPVGYHGRASSIIVSGEDIHRPKGQIKADDEAPVFEPSQKIDFELEMAFIVGKETGLGTSVSTTEAEDYIFGMVLFNDWSARDIQKWEYVPLGPFLGKSFASSVSPWVVTMEALEPFRTSGPKQEPEVLPYLSYEGSKNYDINLQVLIKPGSHNQPSLISKTNFKHLYWNMAQQLAHHTSNGCNLNIGDLMASGTISGAEPDSYGSMLERSWNGTKPVSLDNGEERFFVEDGDTVIMKGCAENETARVGFGELTTKLLPALE